MEKVFEHHHDDKHDTTSTGTGHQESEGKKSVFENYVKTDERRLEEFYQKEERLEEEGETYGGLM